ncbi:MAG: YccF domain-containing protein [Chloroflexota bacterium]
MSEKAKNDTRAPVVLVQEDDKGPGCVVQTVWFLFIGWWLSQIAILLGWLLIVTIILMPLGFALLNKVPYLATLHKPKRQTSVHVQEDGVIVMASSDRPQRPFWQRAVFFLLIGWWFSFIVLELAWLLTSTVLLAPLGLPLFGWFPTALTLRR